jgi:uncharacterized membrane protein
VISINKKISDEKRSSAFFESDVPQDLIFVTVLLAVSIISIYLPVLNETPLRYALSLPLVLFIPGYCLVAAIFPKSQDIDLIERVALSIGISIALDVLIGLGLNYTPLGIRLESVVTCLAVFSLVTILLAHSRRVHLVQDEQFSIQFIENAGALRDDILPAGEQGFDRFLSVALAFVVLVVVLVTALVILAPHEGERFSEFYILNGNLTSSGFPERIIPGVNYPMNIGIGNLEQRNVTYTVETWLIKTEFDNLTAPRIISMDLGDRMTTMLGNNETRIIPYNLTVKDYGYNRIELLLFNETVPGTQVTGTDRINASYRDLHFWIPSD